MGAKWAAEGRTRSAATFRSTRPAGLLAKGHPVGATGVGQLYEAVLQLRGVPRQPGQGCRYRHDPQSRRRRHRLHRQHPQAAGCVRIGRRWPQDPGMVSVLEMQRLRHARCRAARDLPLLSRGGAAAPRGVGRRQALSHGPSSADRRPRSARRAAYAVAVVELDAGVKVTGRLEGPDDVKGLGARVRLASSKNGVRPFAPPRAAMKPTTRTTERPTGGNDMTSRPCLTAAVLAALALAPTSLSADTRQDRRRAGPERPAGDHRLRRVLSAGHQARREGLRGQGRQAQDRARRLRRRGQPAEGRVAGPAADAERQGAGHHRHRIERQRAGVRADHAEGRRAAGGGTVDRHQHHRAVHRREPELHLPLLDGGEVPDRGHARLGRQDLQEDRPRAFDDRLRHLRGQGDPGRPQGAQCPARRGRGGGPQRQRSDAAAAEDEGGRRRAGA